MARMREQARDRNPSYATGNFPLDVHSTDHCRFNETFCACAKKSAQEEEKLGSELRA